MALESVSAGETLIQSNNQDDDDLEDGEIPSDEDDEATVALATEPEETPKPKPENLPKPKVADIKQPDKNKKATNTNTSNNTNNSKAADRFPKYNKNPSDDWAGDVEKAIKAALEEDTKNHEKKNRTRKRERKRGREEKEEDRSKEKRRKLSEEDGNDDDDEMLFVRGASPIRKDCQQDSSPSRRSLDDYDSSSSYDERPVSRHRERDNEKRGNTRSASGNAASNSRRNNKNERNKNKGRNQGRNDRNSRRNQVNEHVQDPDAICMYYMQGKCHRGDDCPYSHNALPPRKMELCKFYLMDCCAKRDKCLYMHHDFPCKFFHTGLKCHQGENCKFSHQPLNEQVKNILLKHLETAPKEILGDFPRLSREGAILMINNTARNLAQGQEASSQKIPSLFELNLSAPNNSGGKGEEKDDENSTGTQNQKTANGTKDRKGTGKKTRWGSDEDRVPYEQIMLLQSANQLGLQLPNAALGLAVQQQLQQQMLTQPVMGAQQMPSATLPVSNISTPEFYTEVKQPNTDLNVNKNINRPQDFTKDVEEDEIREQAKMKEITMTDVTKDIDLRQLLSKKPKNAAKNNLTSTTNKAKLEEESDKDEDTNLVIEVPEHEDKNLIQKDIQSIVDQEIPQHLPKKAQELFARIQQQQRAAQDSFKNLEEKDTNNLQEDWYSEDEDDDDDDEEGGGLTIVLKDTPKDENPENIENKENLKNDTMPPPNNNSSVPQPAVIVDKLGDLSKIDISAEVSKLLSSIKAQSTSSKPSSNTETKENESLNTDSSKNREKSPPVPAPVISRDPRMSRDPRQRRDDRKLSNSPSRVDNKKEEKSGFRLETSIYSSGITSMDANMDTDLRSQIDQDHRRKDLDLRQRFQHTTFGDTDLRVVGNNFGDVKSDVDLRQMLSLPFKPAPSHIPCTEIDGSISSHPPIPYKVHVVDIPRPDYTNLKLSKNDPLVKYDPRLCKIFRISKNNVADSPMSPPPQQMKLEAAKSPPQIRSDPRRKALEASQNNSMMQQQQQQQQQHQHQHQHQHQQQSMETAMKMQMMNSGMMNPGPAAMMPPNPMMNPNMGQMNMMNPHAMPMGMPAGPPMNMNAGVMPPQNQMGAGPTAGYNPRFNAVQRNAGVGLLGPAPGVPGGYPGDNGPPPPPPPPQGVMPYDGPPYPTNNYNYGPPGPMNDPNMMGGGGAGGYPPNPNNFNANGPNDWNCNNQNQNQNQNPNRRGGRVRRRNRNRTDNNRGSRSPP